MANNLDATAELKVEVVKTEEGQSYSVWAISPDGVFCRIKKLMEGLRAEFGGPQIQPHIPLAGSLRLTREADLAKFRSDLCLHAFVAKVDSVVTRVFYYHPVALVFHLPEEVEMETGVDFNLWNPPLPQMSLLYGRLTEEERKKAQEKVYILDESITSLSFPVTRIALYQTNYKNKTLKSWEKIAEYRLHFNN